MTDYKRNKNRFSYISYVSYVFSYVFDITFENIGKIGKPFRVPIFLCR